MDHERPRLGDAPPTIDAMLEAAHRDAAIYYPFTDVIVTDPYEGIADGMTTAFYIGQSHVIGGVTTDMVAVNNNWVFEQLWIGADDKLPRMARAASAVMRDAQTPGFEPDRTRCHVLPV